MLKKKLLIADDDEMSRRIIHKIFHSSYQVLEAANGREALDILAQEQVDALILDIVMPVLDGIEVLKEMAGQPRYQELAILVATSRMEQTERTVLSLGADDVVSKPYDPLVMKKRLGNIILAKGAIHFKHLLEQNQLQEWKIEYAANLQQEAEASLKQLEQIASLLTADANQELLPVLATSILKETKQLRSTLK